MKRLLLALALLLSPVAAAAQCNGVFSTNTVCGTVAGGIPGQVPMSTIIGTITGLNNTWTGTNTFNADAYFKSGRPWADIIAYGADPTGAADSTTPIQNAINALAAAIGGTVYIPPGTYKVTAPLTITSNFISIVGSGRLSSIIKTTSTTADVFSVSTPYSRIEHLGIIGSGTVQTAGVGIDNIGGYGCLYNDLFISDLFSGISLNNASNCAVTNSKMLNLYGAFGIQSANGGGDYIGYNQLDPLFYGGAYTFASGFGAWAQSTAYTTGQVRSANGGFFMCSQNGTSSGTGTGPAITSFNTQVNDGTAKWFFISSTTFKQIQVLTANSNFITHNDLSGPSSAGVIVQTTSDGNIIDQNTVGQIIGSGIQLGTNTTNTLVQGNVVSGSYGQFSAGIIDNNSSATGSRVVNNFINGAGWYGIFVQSSHFTVTDNVIQGTGQTTGSFGIEVAAAVTKFTITGNNVIPGTMSGAIKVNAGASDFYSVTNNLVEGGLVTDSGTGVNKTVIGNN